MNRKPNENNIESTVYSNTKKNQIGRKFSDVFDVLTDSSYYVGTKYAKFFNGTTLDGKSDIYVYDPLEKELDKIRNSKKNELKYLVGLTGMGKTTLLKNYFIINNRDVIVNKRELIVYISFYYAELLSDNPQQSITKEIVKYFTRTVKTLLVKNRSYFTNEYKFWEGFYSFIENNKPTLLEDENISPLSMSFDALLKTKTYEEKTQKLNELSISSPLEYYSCLIKYILESIGNIYNVILIYDDLESKEEKFHKPVVEIARHIHSCFSAVESQLLTIKSIVSMRAYTFRCNIGRQAEARRESIENDVILKKQAVSLHELFEKRFAAVEKKLKARENVHNLDGYDDAKRQMQYVEQQLDKIGGNLIYNLANYNLSDALIAYSNIMINLEWIACNEKEYNGAFVLDAKHYRITTENIIYAIANGNSKKYTGDNGYIPNILLNDKDGTSLIGMYIISYLLINKIDDVYGEKYVEGRILLENIKSLFVKSTDNRIRSEYWHHKINSAMSHLYTTGILFRSLYDIEDADDCQIERKYKDEFKIYLSPRGKCIYNLLSRNAVLLELYRDDIYTELSNNDKLTSELSTAEVFDYLLDYMNICFQIEMRNIGDAIPDLSKYQETVGSKYITSILLEGVVRNITAYFGDTNDIFEKLKSKWIKICKNMMNYSEDISKRYNVKFDIPNYLETNIDIKIDCINNKKEL